MKTNNLNDDSISFDASTIFFKEDFLHYLWKYKLFNIQQLQTLSKQEISIIKGGTHNKNEGPDFFNAQIKIQNQLWVGNVEIHLKSSDWYAHQHEIDSNYDAVILHVVWEYDVPVFTKGGMEIPTLQLKDYVAPSVLKSYYHLFEGSQKWILCEETIGKTEKFVINAWLNRLYFERLESKAKQIFKMLDASSNDWEAVLFQLICKSFGMKLNSDAFLNLSKSFGFSLIRKNAHKIGLLESLLFGQAGFLNECVEDGYYNYLKKEYEYLKIKYQLVPMEKNQFLFFRLRPSNFPSIRISQLAVLYEEQTHLFSKVKEYDSLDDFYHLFSVKSSVYWDTHYVFGKVSKKRLKNTSKAFIDVLLLNAILPIKYAYMKHQNKINFDVIENIIAQIKPEKNAVISKFQAIGVKVDTAFDSQALLELKHSYCDYKKCLECGIGLHLLKSV